MSRNHECDHSSCHETIEAYRQQEVRFDKAIEELLAPHRPYVWEQGIRPGNMDRRVPCYCTTCSQAWPCTAFNDLRWLYGKTHDWEPATIPFEPLVLHQAKPSAGIAAEGSDD